MACVRGPARRVGGGRSNTGEIVINEALVVSSAEPADDVVKHFVTRANAFFMVVFKLGPAFMATGIHLSC